MQTRSIVFEIRDWGQTRPQILTSKNLKKNSLPNLENPNNPCWAGMRIVVPKHKF